MIMQTMDPGLGQLIRTINQPLYLTQHPNISSQSSTSHPVSSTRIERSSNPLNCSRSCLSADRADNADPSKSNNSSLGLLVSLPLPNSPAVSPMWPFERPTENLPSRTRSTSHSSTSSDASLAPISKSTNERANSHNNESCFIASTITDNSAPHSSQLSIPRVNHLSSDSSILDYRIGGSLSGDSSSLAAVSSAVFAVEEARVEPIDIAITTKPGTIPQSSTVAMTRASGDTLPKVLQPDCEYPITISVRVVVFVPNLNFSAKERGNLKYLHS
ncbi:unnamed protein product [Protopolystoma xenopodis]|uniref:Uncharacterized protein n=1 Tax=Protopolystoma xenopodis TaxID=117903 RepID=A0A448WV65_9PLAT|nr:unnamed protein product [Protopolystoma xenopodis]